jgi:hypothetical protein
MILVELMFGIMLAVVLLAIVPLLLLMAGVAGVVLLWAIAPTALLVALVLWLAFPHAMGVDFGSMPGTLTNLERDPLDTQRWNACGP